MSINHAVDSHRTVAEPIDIYRNIFLKLLIMAAALVAAPEHTAAAVDDADAAPQQGLHATQAQPEGGVVAEPIAPATTLRFPHLAAFEGHLLLGGPRVQVVIAGVQPAPTAPTWMPGILAVFERHREIWLRKATLSSLSLSYQLPSGGLIAAAQSRATSVTWSVDQNAGVATLSMRVSDSADTNGQHLLHWRLDTTLERLIISAGTVRGLGAKDSRMGKSDAVSGHWVLRLVGDGHSILGGTSGGKATNYLMRGDGGDAMAVLGYGVMDIKTEASKNPYGFSTPAPFVDLSLKGFALPVPGATLAASRWLQGFELYLTSTAAVRVLERTAAVNHCLGQDAPKAPPQPNLEARVASMAACSTPSPLPTLRLAQQDLTTTGAGTDAASGGRHLDRGVWLFGTDGHALVYIVVPGESGQSITVPIPTAGSYELGDTPFGRTISGLGPINLQSGSQVSVLVPRTVLGRIRLTLPPEEAGRAALVNIERLDLATGPLVTGSQDQMSAISLVSDAPRAEMGRDKTTGDAAGWQLGPRSWLVKRWPAEFEVAEGSYSLVVANGRRGRWCAGRLVVRSGYRAWLDCGAATSANVPAPPSQGWRELVFADLGSEVAPSISDLQALAEATGSDILGSPSPMHEVKKNPRSSTADAPSNPGFLTTLAVFDPAVGTGLRFIPANAELAHRWQLALKGERQEGRAQARDGRLGKFVQFLRDEGARGWLELTCPGAGMSADEYQNLAIRLQPQALRLLGCPLTWDQTDITRLVSTPLARNLPPPQLTTAPYLGLADDQVFFPRVAFSSKRGDYRPPADATGEEIFVHLLEKGAWTASLGAYLTIDAVQAADAAPSQKPSEGGTRGAGHVALLTCILAPGVNAKQVAIYTEKGLLQRFAVTSAAAGGGRLRLPLPSLKDRLWIRAELLGSASLVPSKQRPPVQNINATPSTKDAAALVPLALTNFRAIKDLLPAP